MTAAPADRLGAVAAPSRAPDRTPRFAHVTGAVLAGGRSSRMGRDKALLLHRGVTLLEHMVSTLRNVTGQVIIVADDPSRYAFLGAPVYPDIFEHSGPLAGIHAALTHAAGAVTLVVSCDLPLVTPRLLGRIVAAAEGDVTVPRAAGRAQPLCGVYGPAVLPVAEEYLRGGNYRLQDVLHDERLTVSILDLHRHSAAFLNVNTPADYLRLRRRRPSSAPSGT